MDFLKLLVSINFMPHVYCLRDPGLIKLHAISDSRIAISYFAIPISLFLFVRRFGVFIRGCSITLRLPSSRQYLAAIAESSEDAIISEDLNGIITSWNEGAERIFGYSASEVLGKSIELLFSPVEISQSVDIRRKIREGKRLSHVAAVRRCKDGRLIAVSVTDSPICNAAGRIVGISKIVRDVTGQKQAEQTLARVNSALVDSEDRFRTLIDFVPDMLWMTDADGSASYFGRRYQAYTGMSMRALLGFGWKESLHPEDWERVEQAWSDSIRTEDSYEVEYRIKRADGVFRWFVARAIPIHDSNGKIIQWLGSATDIDELKRTERALRRSNEELEQFAYAAAHDLQEPLRNVANSVGMLKLSLGDNVEGSAAEWIEESVKGAQRMQAMVKDLLTYSRTVDEFQSPTPPSTDTEQAAHRALENLKEILAETKALVHLEPLPFVPVHEIHLLQLFQNLIGNAVKYRQPNAAPVVRVSAVVSGSEWQFAVQDNGIGFDPAYADRIFRLFKRLHNRDEYPGNGIGLAVCARIVSHYGGRIWAEGKPGEGATFHFTLPGHK
jgi:PAS domain S-box-containing protein